MSKKQTALPREVSLHTDENLHLEDKAMKVAAQYFESPLLPLIDVTGMHCY